MFPDIDADDALECVSSNHLSNTSSTAQAILSLVIRNKAVLHFA